MEYAFDRTINEHITKKINDEGKHEHVQGLLYIEPEHMMSQIKRRPTSAGRTTLAQVKSSSELSAPDDDSSGIAEVWESATTWM